MKIAELFIRLGVDNGNLKRGLTEADRALTKFGGSADRLGNSLRNAFAFAGVGLGLRELTQQADTWKLIESRIRLVTRSQAELKTVQSALFGVAQETRSSFESVATLYARVARNADQLGLSQQQVIDFSSAVSKAIKVSGATASEASAGMVQLSQALASGTLRGDEFRSIMENLPGVARALAQGLGVPLGALRDMSQAGELTADKVVKAVLKMKGSIDRDFATVPKTVGDAFTTLRNELQRLIGGMDGASGASGLFARGIVAVSRNLTAIAAILVGATSAWVAYKVAVYAAAAAHAIVASAATIRAFIQLATTVRSMAAAWALVSAATVGAKAGIVGMLAGMTAAIVAYKAMTKVADEDTQGFTESLQALGVAAGGVAAPVVAATKNIMETVRGMGEELGRLHLLNGAMGRSESARARLLILYDAEAQKRDNATKFIGKELVAVNQLTDAITQQKLRAHDATAVPAAAKETWEAMLASMGDVLSLQSAMKEAGMNTVAVDNQIFLAYQRINQEIERGVRLTNEQKAAAISLRTALGAAMAPMPGGVGITGAGNVRPTMTVKGKGAQLFDGKDQYGNATQGQFPDIKKVPPALESLGSKMKAGLGEIGADVVRGLASVATAMLVGGGGRGSQIGAGLGSAVGGGLGAILGGSFGGPLGGSVGKVLGGAVGSVLGTLGGSLFGGLFDKKKKVANGLDLMADGLNRVNQSLRNAPSGYLVTSQLHGATNTGGGPGPGGGPLRPTGPGEPRQIVFTGNVSVLANNPAQFVQEIGRIVSQQMSRGGTSALALAVR